MTLDIRYADAPLGHEIRGLDLSQPLDDATFAEIENAYNTYGVICFRNQKITPEQHIAFSKRFGPLDKYVIDKYNHPDYPDIFVVSNIIDANGKPLGMEDAGRYWHSDMWSQQRPPRGSMLYALEVPRQADGTPLGDTYFASTAAALDDLPADLMRRIDGRKALYTRAKANAYRASISPDNERTRESAAARSTIPMVEIWHPLIRVHPISGRKCLYLSEGMVARIEGYDEAESQKLCEELLAHIISPPHVYRHRWQEGDLVMWDNITCIHRATGDFALPQRRLVYRTTLSAASLYKDESPREEHARVA